MDTFQSFQFGSVLSTSVRAMARNVVAFLLIAALVFTPVLLYLLHWIDGLKQGGSLTGFTRAYDFTLLVAVLSALASTVVTAVLTYGVVMDVQGHRVSARACLTNGLMRALPALGVAIVSAIAIMLGMVLLVVPGIIMACMLYVAIPASVMERPGIFGALGRSHELTAGHRLEVFGILMLVGVVRIFCSKIGSLVIAPTSLEDLKTLTFVLLGLDAILAAMGAVIAAAAYCALRLEKEGTFTTRLGTAFE